MSDIAYFYRQTETIRILKGDNLDDVLRNAMNKLLSWVVQGIEINAFIFTEDYELGPADSKFKWRYPINIEVDMHKDGMSRKLVATVSAEGEWVDELPS